MFADLAACGNFTEIEVYDDLRPEQFSDTPISQPHRRVDVELVAADTEGGLYLTAFTEKC